LTDLSGGRAARSNGAGGSGGQRRGAGGVGEVEMVRVLFMVGGRSPFSGNKLITPQNNWKCLTSSNGIAIVHNP
jgi:hypothetical protein